MMIHNQISSRCSLANNAYNLRSILIISSAGGAGKQLVAMASLYPRPFIMMYFSDIMAISYRFKEGRLIQILINIDLMHYLFLPLLSIH